MHQELTAASVHLLGPKIKVIRIEKELWLVVELWCELLDIAAAVQAVVPGGRHIGEQAVSMVESAALQVAVHRSEWLHANQVEEHHACSSHNSVLASMDTITATLSTMLKVMVDVVCQQWHEPEVSSIVSDNITNSRHIAHGRHFLIQNSVIQVMSVYCLSLFGKGKQNTHEN